MLIALFGTLVETPDRAAALASPPFSARDRTYIVVSGEMQAQKRAAQIAAATRS
jgi:hypothetical protein